MFVIHNSTDDHKKTFIQGCCLDRGLASHDALTSSLQAASTSSESIRSFNFTSLLLSELLPFAQQSSRHRHHRQHHHRHHQQQKQQIPQQQVLRRRKNSADFDSMDTSELSSAESTKQLPAMQVDSTTNDTLRNGSTSNDDSCRTVFFADGIKAGGSRRYGRSGKDARNLVDNILAQVCSGRVCSFHYTSCFVRLLCGTCVVRVWYVCVKVCVKVCEGVSVCVCVVCV